MEFEPVYAAPVPEIRRRATKVTGGPVRYDLKPEEGTRLPRRCLPVGGWTAMSQFRVFALLLAATAVVTGCEIKKVTNPLSPSVAGPIPGVTITAPRVLQPGAGTEIDPANQPITIVVGNATTTGVRPLTYSFELATDLGFTNQVYTRQGVSPGDSGKTQVTAQVTLPSPLAADHTYYLRVRAEDGANTGPYCDPVTFSVVTPSLDAPVPLNPANGATVTELRPQFRIRNSTRKGSIGVVSYQFQGTTDQAFTGLSVTVAVQEGTGETAFGLPTDLTPNTSYYWRVRGSDGRTTSAWTATQMFRTQAPAPPPPSPPPPSSGAWPTTGPEVVAWANAHYPERLVAGVSLSERQANMAFLRDRMIEAGICGGMDLGWNLKRGGPELSIDFLVDRSSGDSIGVDIASDYDNTSHSLQLQWAVAGPGSMYKEYSPRPTCR